LRVTFSNCPSIKEGSVRRVTWNYRLHKGRLHMDASKNGNPRRFKGAIQGDQLRLEALDRRGRSSIVGRRANGGIEGQLITSRTEKRRACTAISEIGRDVAAAISRVGVAECDDLIAKYLACLYDKVDESSRPAMLKVLRIAARSWTQAAQKEGGQATVASSCREQKAKLQRGLSHYGCKW
jgi:hypothetical protein